MIATILALALMQEAPEQSAKEIDRLCADLASDDLEARDTATAELPKLGRAALKAVRRLTSSSDAEVRGRAQDVFARIIAPLKAGAIKFEIEIHDASYRAGEAVRFTARLRNVEEFPCEASFGSVPVQIQQKEQLQLKQAQEQNFVNDIEDEDVLTAGVVLQPGETLDVTCQTWLTFVKDGQGFSTLDNAKPGTYKVTAVCQPNLARQVDNYASSIRINRVQLRNFVPQQGQQMARNSFRNVRENAAPRWQAEAEIVVK